MKKKFIERTLTVIMAVTMAGMLMTGCGKSADTAANEPQVTESQETEPEVIEPEVNEPEVTEPADAEVPGAPYFAKGVYYNYAKEAENPDKTYFYVFSDNDYGYTADGANEGIGLPFDTEQSDGKVKFLFGGADESEDYLVITGVDNGVVYGYFEGAEDRELVFEPVEGADPESFVAENFVNGPESSVYHDANGWSIKYDATKFEVTTKSPDVFIVYKGESAGTNMITVTYSLENAEDAIDEIGDAAGENVEFLQSIFPGTQDVTSYYAILNPNEEGSGAYMTAFARDYMEGSLIVRVDGHMGEDEDKNMQLSDQIAAVIDSFTFDFE
ncbi:MAG: hypothetical protein K5888_02265 [Lachnospiraceae bacterium]|nr:hypothetical protein [Lachnospiraceae bacterium]